jgi:superoxide reductase
MEFCGIVKTGKDEGKEKHVPRIAIDKGHKEGKDIVRVVVGHDVPHPQHRRTSHLLDRTLRGEAGYQVINLGRAAWAPFYANPNIRFQINQIEEFKAFHALAYCNIHGVWESSLEV